MLSLNLILAIFTQHVRGRNIPVKRQAVRLDKNIRPNYMLATKSIIILIILERLKYKKKKNRK